ncbi:DoxX family protein [Actinoplanes derwentensis]|uniref:DoxX-like family protein n=1 Tax=Actinoplanes derwentensis TaxID=113562 RepID=A0A1H2A361_9ACTN|nr:DoxX family protein [Actinoplanes derwentensis]GID83421.1 membrane protein [Actinoplanes derwentensis]SDT39926.1 DoxX-like family protein [Actinoplanes derwentensis]
MPAAVGGVALANIGSGTAKIRRAEPSVSGMIGVGVPESWFVPLALLNFAGAAGLLIGIGWRPLGIAAAVGLVLYFAGALIAHLRVKDFKGMAPPAVFFVVSAAALVLGIVSA